jgi:hypothetical protein
MVFNNVDAGLIRSRIRLYVAVALLRELGFTSPVHVW